MALQPNAPSRYVKAIQYESMTDLLTHFRQTLERENNQSIQELDAVNAAMILSDLCAFLGLSDQNLRKILGATASTWIDQMMSKSAQLTIRH
jgi:hypothetical protein